MLRMYVHYGRYVLSLISNVGFLVVSTTNS
jgi:hypothetical protein